VTFAIAFCKNHKTFLVYRVWFYWSESSEKRF